MTTMTKPTSTTSKKAVAGKAETAEEKPKLYRLKPGFDKHRRPPKQIGQREICNRQGQIIDVEKIFAEPEIILPGTVFEPTEQELKSFGFKFEVCDDAGVPVSAEELDDFYERVPLMNVFEIRK